MSTTTQAQSRPVASLSREPSDYVPTEHFIIRKKERQIAGWKIRDAIENGKVIDDKVDNRYGFRSDYIEVIVQINENEANGAVTIVNGGMDR